MTDHARPEALAIIPARGGSQGIPRKNVKPLCGRPLIAWTIDAARDASSVDRIVVSTDDDEIADVSRGCGAEVVRRPPDLAGPLASSESALLHVLAFLRSETEGSRAHAYQPEVVVFLQCTSPLTMPEDIDGTARLVLQGGYDSAVTMAPFHGFVWREGTEGQMEGVNHDASRRLMRQQRDPEYLEVGAVYAMRTPGLLHHGFRFFGRTGRYLLPALRAFEIDESGDWERAELLMQLSGKVGRLGDGRRGSFGGVDVPETEPVPRHRSRPFPRVQAVVTDFDGVLTDNRVQVDQEGREAVVCHRGDGWGVSLLKRAGIEVACISTEANPVVRVRCQKLGIPFWQGQDDKLAALKAFLQQTGIAAERCAYIGNDTNDKGCLQYAGLAIVPRDAAPEVVPLADWQTRAAGGEGVLREVASRILANQAEEGAIADG